MRLSLMTILENAAKKAKYSGSMIAFYVPRNVARETHSLFRDVPGDLVEPKYAHITLGLVHNWEGNEDKIKMLINKFCAHQKPFNCSIRSFDTFPPSESSDDKFVLYAKPEADELYDVHSKLLPFMKKNGIKIDNGSFDFSPHMTIKYCDKEPDISKDYQKDFILDKLSFAIGDRVYSRGLG